MIKITKTEAKYMRLHGFEDRVKHSYSKHPTMFLVEEPRALRALQAYRESLVIK